MLSNTSSPVLAIAEMPTQPAELSAATVFLAQAAFTRCP